MRVFIVARRLHREALAAALWREPTCDVVGMDEPSVGVSSRVAAACPHVALVDATTPYAITLIPGLRRAAPRVAVVALSSDAPGAELAACAGAVRGVADDVVALDASVAELIRLLRRVTRGVCPHREMDRDTSERPSSPSARPALTPREQQVVELVHDARSNKEIAAALGVELATAKRHVHHVLRKLGARSRGEVIAWSAARRPT